MGVDSIFGPRLGHWSFLSDLLFEYRLDVDILLLDVFVIGVVLCEGIHLFGWFGFVDLYLVYLRLLPFVGVVLRIALVIFTLYDFIFAGRVVLQLNLWCFDEHILELFLTPYLFIVLHLIESYWLQPPKLKHKYVYWFFLPAYILYKLYWTCWYSVYRQ